MYFFFVCLCIKLSHFHGIMFKYVPSAVALYLLQSSCRQTAVAWIVKHLNWQTCSSVCNFSCCNGTHLFVSSGCYMRLGVPTVVLPRIHGLWDVTPCCLVTGSWFF